MEPERAGDRNADLAGRRAVVTGSSSGIGLAIATELARAGAHVALHANRTFARAEALARELSEGGRRAAALRADLRDPESLRRLVDEAFAVLGGVEIWVNNAGADILTGEGRLRTFAERLEDLLAVDVRATILLTREVGSRMLPRGGTIINVGWDQALAGMGGESGELFAAAKGAVMAFSKSAAVSLAPHVRVNCIAPGWIRTAWGTQADARWQERVVRETPLGRWGKPEDVALAARFLASDEASFLTGQVLAVNGGTVR